MDRKAVSKRRRPSSGNLADKSQEAVGNLLSRANKSGSSGKLTHDNNLPKKCSISEHSREGNQEKFMEPTVRLINSEAGDCGQKAARNTPREENFDGVSLDSNVELDNIEWEDGLITTFVSSDYLPQTIEVKLTPDSIKQKRIRRASAEDKDLAALVHKVHLLSLLARGRMIDRACDDPLIQASLLSLLPLDLLKIVNIGKLTAKALQPVVLWFHNNFHVQSKLSAERPFHLALASALESHEGSPEEIAALSVALFRALKLTTRFVSILDVASLKPDIEKSRSLKPDATESSKAIFNSSTLMVSKPEHNCMSPIKFPFHGGDSLCETSDEKSHRSNKDNLNSQNSQSTDTPDDDMLRVSGVSPSKAEHSASEACPITNSHKSKRKGDLEFEMQMEMALSATAVGTKENKGKLSMTYTNGDTYNFSSSLKRMKKISSAESPTCSQGISTAVGSIKVGSPLYWAEVYCNGENLTGKWVHIDAVNLIIDGEQKVEAMAAACRTSMKYVVAFAGQGAKDVTRRYCLKWYKIASERVSSVWWEAVLAPLRELEAATTDGTVNSEMHQNGASNEHKQIHPVRQSDNPTNDNLLNNFKLHVESAVDVSSEHGKKISLGSVESYSFVPRRSSLEDIELETRALTEPLPTNQQAYKNHQLYAIEKWLTKYQVLHPKGPVLGFCSGHPVYSRTCVQTLKTKEKWLREGLQIKANELPAKELRRSAKIRKVQASQVDDFDELDSEGDIIKLYGKWQLEPLCLPCATNGIVPKNERGQVEVWSEKCLPPGTVHLRLPRIFFVAKKLGIDYAPAMVGFEFRNGRSYPVFDGVVVCTEFKNVLLEACEEEEERMKAEEKRRDERQTISRWYQLLSSIVTRQKLSNRYRQSLSPETSTVIQPMISKPTDEVGDIPGKHQRCGYQQEDSCGTGIDALATRFEEHEHSFLKADESFDEESLVLTKRCRCGFSVQVEEL